MEPFKLVTLRHGEALKYFGVILQGLPLYIAGAGCQTLCCFIPCSLIAEEHTVLSAVETNWLLLSAS
ncbi:hypothetical protein chiPu_0012952 [Chiloscyllium punctatum]|uniref:Uncharacterized protein n=1 Tax=Chiloscyllium punctatum TaxID=137246 RepID=A0A401SVS2_CHIPU|nr:hypothetical protein [Chiloscyllium punctatum]